MGSTSMCTIARRAVLEIKLDEDDIERIRKYASDAKRGGWQQRVLTIFGRVLNLEHDAAP